MSKSAIKRDAPTDETNQADSEDVLVARIAADRRAGRDTSKDVKALLKRAGKNNRAALDRLAK
ncbi:MAG TPA: hypothetical protein VND67_11610 [Acidimicrobiales bacterium]|nr:hypothetical protein [Acidimicrobiales bacterium]